MNDFHNILLPDFITIHLKGGPCFSTSYVSTISGLETRMSDRIYSIQQYSLAGSRLAPDQFEKFNCFFRSRNGMNCSFRIRDHADYKLENQIITADSSNRFAFTIFKKYDDEISPYFRRIKLIRPESFRLNISPGSVDYVNGIIYMDEPMAENQELIINAEFDVAVRFCSDEFKYSFCQDGSILIDSLELKEVLI